jgi:hypothetical protein
VTSSTRNLTGCREAATRAHQRRRRQVSRLRELRLPSVREARSGPQPSSFLLRSWPSRTQSGSWSRVRAAPTHDSVVDRDRVQGHASVLRAAGGSDGQEDLVPPLVRSAQRRLREHRSASLSPRFRAGLPLRGHDSCLHSHDPTARENGISDLRIAAVVSLTGSPALGLQRGVGNCGRKPRLAQSAPADQVIPVRSRPPMPLLSWEAVPDPGSGHEAENSVTELPQ